MHVSRASLVLIAIGLGMAPISAQMSRVSRCLHGENETRVQQQRRHDAIDSADLINRVLERSHRGGVAYPGWDDLAKSRALEVYRQMPRTVPGGLGDLARKIEWGTEQPLPGWQIHYVAAQEAYAFSLTDLRDPCQLTIASNDTRLITEGPRADFRGQARVIPLDSSQ